ncbi:hypothetical protein OGM63_21080 [Plectonema radiosum NIES-515]|uniref:Uncharacterized protein n=1 Tax=Plectonema radiosum NIES-515 TaxID=2986073 RepID=A0ABT3B4S9_9CYAN|nr:hypothetical protein [Plectonema radiosum]MCV3215970.1 hypothetical protein [Plectonema radiosum NIES-515]
MTFKKNHQLGFVSTRKRKLAKQPISFKGFEGQLEELRKIDGWQESLREVVDRLIDAANIDGG